MLYDWIKALHVISVICWMAGLFYLPRLFVYHAMETLLSEQSNVFKTMEKKLYYYIMWPSLVATYFFGLWLFYENPDILIMPYMWVKIALVILLTIIHFVLGHFLILFKKNKNKHSHKFFRVLNEGPTILLIGIVILVIVKPSF